MKAFIQKEITFEIFNLEWDLVSLKKETIIHKRLESGEYKAVFELGEIHDTLGNVVFFIDVEESKETRHYEQEE